MEGVRHILEGLDHVLFVVCLVLGASGLGAPGMARVTGFTIGHSVTLTLGFFGYYPTGAWFVPLVETGIALSIVYTARGCPDRDRTPHDDRCYCAARRCSTGSASPSS